MREAHGGIGGELGENPEELAEQEDLLRQVAEARRAAEVWSLEIFLLGRLLITYNDPMSGWASRRGPSTARCPA